MMDLTSDAISKSNIYYLMIGSLMLGILFDFLFFEKYFGISVFIFEVTAIFLALRIGKKFNFSFRPALWILILALFFVAMVAIRANPFLAFLNIVASMVLLLLAIQVIHKKQISNFRIFDYFIAIIVTPIKILHHLLQTISFLTTASDKPSATRLKKVIVGTAMALPFLIIFGALFASADLAFRQLIDFIFRFHVSDELVGHGIVIIGIMAISLGVFVYICTGRIATPAFEANEKSKPDKRLINRTIEIKVFLWLIAGLFAVFLLFQLAYLFGGVINISESNFTYAEYARKGFWELLTVACFTLIILLVIDANTQSKESRFSWYTVPSLILIGEIFVIIISAFKRLTLYQEAYGLTTLRLYALGFIIFLGVTFLILAIKLWREKVDAFFASGVFILMIIFLVMVNILNPDAYIAKKNIEHFEQTGKIDANYLGNMSEDAVPFILSVYDQLQQADKAIIKQQLMVKKAHLVKQQSEWQSYNISRQQALSQLNQKVFD